MLVRLIANTIAFACVVLAPSFVVFLFSVGLLAKPLDYASMAIGALIDAFMWLYALPRILK